MSVFRPLQPKWNATEDYFAFGLLRCRLWVSLDAGGEEILTTDPLTVPVHNHSQEQGGWGWHDCSHRINVVFIWVLSAESEESSKRKTATVSSKTALSITGLALFFFVCSINELEKRVPALEFLFQGISPRGMRRGQDWFQRWHYMGSEIIHRLWGEHVKQCHKSFPTTWHKRPGAQQLLLCAERREPIQGSTIGMKKQSLEEVIEALPGALPIMSCRVREKCVPVLCVCVCSH